MRSREKWVLSSTALEEPLTKLLSFEDYLLDVVAAYHEGIGPITQPNAKCVLRPLALGYWPWDDQ
jgi:hypothetical protein